MKPLHIVTAAVLLCTQPCAAQDSVSKISVMVSPALFVPVSIAVQAGVQYKFSKKWAVLGEVAVPVFFPDSEQEVQDMRQWRFSVDLKRRTRLRDDRQDYVALQLGYLTRRFESERGVYATRGGAERYDSATVSSPVLSTAFKIGGELYTNNKVYADVFLGLGARFVFTDYDAKSVVTVPAPRPSDGTPIPEYAWRYNYTVTRFHLTAGLRVGVRL